MEKRNKAKHGTVVIRTVAGRLRLIWSYQGQRYCLVLSLIDTPSTKAIANAKAAQIYQDIALGKFDPSLDRYRDTQDVLRVDRLFERFMDFKRSEIQPTTLDKYRSVALYLNRTKLGDKPAQNVDVYDALEFKNWVLTQVKPLTARDRITLLKASWEFGISKGWLTVNPWAEALKNIKPTPRKPPQPFTQIEIQSILDLAYSSNKYRCYAPFLEFLASTGARIGEVIGLKWGHISDSCSEVWIGEQLTRRGDRRPAKCGKSEVLHLSAPLQVLLLKLMPENHDPERIVFTALEGGRIRDENFRNRIWRPILEELKLTYRKPYFLRSTATSHFLNAGLTPVEVARITRNSPRTIYQSYAGSINRQTEIPVYFSQPIKDA
jgi:integrase